MASFGLYGHIRANNIKSVALVAGFPVLLVLLTFAGLLATNGFLAKTLDEATSTSLRALPAALPFALGAAALWLMVAWKFHQKIVDTVTGARDITRQENPRLWNLVENLAITAGLPMPQVQVIATDALNAYASGLDDDRMRVAVTSGLLNALDDRELSAVIAHELTHIKNRDTRLMVVVAIFAGIITFIGEVVYQLLRVARFRSSGSSSSRKGGGGAAVAILIAIAIVAVAYVLAIVLRFALSRRREFLADAGAVELTKDPDAMISALRKIENRAKIEDVPSVVQSFFIEAPHRGFAGFMASHPPIEARVKALVTAAGGHDPGPIEMLPEPPAEPEDVSGTIDGAPPQAQGPQSGPLPS